MDALKKLPQLMMKHKYAVLVLLIGIVLMLIPTTDRTTADKAPTESKEEQNISEELTRILSKIEGVGKVEVMLTLAVGEQAVYETDEDGDVVIITDADRTESGLIHEIHGPIYQGAIVVCQGADRASVRLAIVEAVSNVTGLAFDRISVLKMN